jgi:hypothetical protein
MAVARYRERRTVAQSKSDHVDAMTLANILRTDMHAHRQLPADSELARSIAVLARAHQDAIWRRTKASNELRSLLREYFPGFLAIFAHRDGGLTSRVARAVLAIAPTPAKAARLSTARIAAGLRRAGRQRGIDALAVELRDALSVPQLRQEASVEQAMGSQALRLLATLDTECDSVNELAAATVAGPAAPLGVGGVRRIPADPPGLTAVKRGQPTTHPTRGNISHSDTAR